VNRAIRELEARTPNLRFLDCDRAEICGLVFVVTTLWFADEELNPYYAPGLADFSMIDGFVPWVYQEHERAVRFLEDEAGQADVVVTHHIPSLGAVAPEWRGHPLNRFFVCDLDDLIARHQPPWWVFGHTHSAGQYRVGNSRLITNPLGYPGEPNPGFDSNLVIELQPRQGPSPLVTT
jgi:hypothetical protein